jgi:DNA-directed RNA polymerase beta subunit
MTLEPRQWDNNRFPNEQRHEQKNILSTYRHGTNGTVKQVEKLNQEDKHLIKTFIGAFLTKRQIQKLAKVKSPGLFIL